MIQSPTPGAPRTGSGIVVLVVVGAWVVSVAIAFFSGRESMRAEVKQSVEDALRGAFAGQEPAPSRPSPGDGASRSAVEESKQVVTTTPLELYRSFADNQVGASDYLRGKVVRITAPVSYVSNNMFGGDRSAVVFTVPVSDFMNPNVAFWFDREFRSMVGRLTEGQQVTVEGTFHEQALGGDLEFNGTAIY